MPDVISLGEALFDLFAGPAGTTLGAARTFTPAPGGAPANVAVGLARLGIDAGFVGRVGADSFGSRLLELLRDEGVDTAHCLPVAGGQTTIALVATSSPVDQDFVLFCGADTLLRPEHLDRAYLAGARVFTYGSVTLSAGARDAALQAARWAREDGVLVAFDANYRPAVWPGEAAARDAIAEALRYADIAKLNEVEMKLLTGTDDLRAGCRCILDLGVRLCLITLGADGVWFDDGRFSGSVSGFGAEVVDTTGCGDAFLAAFLAGLVAEPRTLEELDGKVLHRLVEAANAAGSLTRRATARSRACRPAPRSTCSSPEEDRQAISTLTGVGDSRYTPVIYSPLAGTGFGHVPRAGVSLFAPLFQVGFLQFFAL